MLVSFLLLVSCGSDGATPAPTTASVSPSTTTSPLSDTPSPTPSAPPVESPLVVLDPGHNGGNLQDRAAINREVPAGRGQKKPCNTTGTSTDTGYPEHAFTFDVAHRVGAILSTNGIKVSYTRENDTGVGPCVDQRAALGNAPGVAAVISIHADGSTERNAHGFHIAYSSPPLNAAQGEAATKLVAALRDSMRVSFPVSTYIGQNGLSPRNDLAGLNLATRPAALVECGNMRNPAEAAAMSTSDGRQRYAEVIAAGIRKFLGR